METRNPNDYNHVLSVLVRETLDLERACTMLENDRTPVYPRIDAPTLAVEGQLIISDDDVVYSYLNGAWQDANSA